MFRKFLLENRLEDLLCSVAQFHPFPVLEEREPWNQLSEEVKKLLVDWGVSALEGYPQLTAHQFMAYYRTGERVVFEKPYFDRRKKLIGAVMAECVENQDRFLDAIIDGVWLICEESTWCVSAHNNQEPDDMYPLQKKYLPDIENPYIDLFAAQTAAVLAYALYFMKEKLNKISPLITARIKYEIHKRIIQPFLTHNDFWWMGYGAKIVNNWNPWILSNIIDAALITCDDSQKRIQVITRAMIMLDHYLQIMPEDGGCDEGAGYFNAAGASLLDCLESLYCASNGKINFYDDPHIAAIGSYPEKVHISGDYYLNFADCDARPLIDAERLYTYGIRTENARLISLGASLLASTNRAVQLLLPDTPQVNRTLFNLFAKIDFNQPKPEPLPFMQLKDLQVHAWYQNGLYAAIKGGHNDESHNHNDIGTFVVYVDGQPEIVDMGNKVYTAASFGPKRYTMINTRSRNHNIPIVGGVEQSAGRMYEARVIKADDKGACLDLTNAYPKEALINCFLRTFTHLKDVVVLCDEISLLQQRPVELVFMLRNEPVIAKKGTVRFGQLEMQFSDELNIKIEEITIDDVRMQKSFPGSLWRLVLESREAAYHKYEFKIHRS